MMTRNPDAHAISKATVAGLPGPVDFRLTDSETFLGGWKARRISTAPERRTTS